MKHKGPACYSALIFGAVGGGYWASYVHDSGLMLLSGAVSLLGGIAACQYWYRAGLDRGRAEATHNIEVAMTALSRFSDDE